MILQNINPLYINYTEHSFSSVTVIKSEVFSEKENLSDYLSGDEEPEGGGSSGYEIQRPEI